MPAGRAVGLGGRAALRAAGRVRAVAVPDGDPARPRDLGRRGLLLGGRRDGRLELPLRGPGAAAGGAPPARAARPPPRAPPHGALLSRPDGPPGPRGAAPAPPR